MIGEYKVHLQLYLMTLENSEPLASKLLIVLPNANT